MRVFLDTNVLLDWLLDRRHASSEEATSIIRMAENDALEISISGGSLFTLAYVLEKSGLKNEHLKTSILRILQLVEVVPAGNEMYINACLNPFKDLEDAFQYEIASSNSKTNYFITGNIKDFKPFQTSQLPVLSPKEFMDIFSY